MFRMRCRKQYWFDALSEVSVFPRNSHFSGWQNAHDRMLQLPESIGEIRILALSSWTIWNDKKEYRYPHLDVFRIHVICVCHRFVFPGPFLPDVLTRFPALIAPNPLKPVFVHVCIWIYGSKNTKLYLYEYLSRQYFQTRFCKIYLKNCKFVQLTTCKAL